MTIIKNVPFDLANTRVDKAASELFPDFSRTQIKKWILDGRILINGDLSKPKEYVQENDEIEINPIEEKKVSWEAQNINFDVHYEADDFIVINKIEDLGGLDVRKDCITNYKVNYDSLFDKYYITSKVDAIKNTSFFENHG